MSLKYFARYRFNSNDVAEEDFGIRDLAVESGSIDTVDDSQHGSCLSLDGTTSLLSTGGFANIADGADRAFSLWAKITTVEATTNQDDSRSGQRRPSPVLCYGELASPNAFVLYACNTEGYPEFYDYHTSRFKISGDVIKNDKWTFLTFSFKSQVLTIFADGEEIFSTTVPLTTGTSDPLRIGTDAQGEYFEGCLLDLRIWESALEASVVDYMFSVGPNFDEQLPSPYVEKQFSRSSVVAGNILCRTMYGVQTKGDKLTESFFCVNENAEPKEAVRIEHSQDDYGIASQTVRVRDGGVLRKTIEISPENTTFSSTSSSVVFSAEGVHLLNGGQDLEKGCIFFGAGRDFRMRVGDGSFLIEAYSSETGGYRTKMEISSL